MKSWKELKFWHNPATAGLYADLYDKGKDTLPSSINVYRALDDTPFDQVKVVILGQDPYPTKGHAHGLAFSVPSGVKPLPGSLRNVLRELQSDLHLPEPRFGDLSDWARRGVLLLNTILTVSEGRPLSHKGMGWEKLTVEVIQKLSTYRKNLVFILWGRTAQEYRGLVDESKHLVLAGVHPSPLSANRGFFGSRPFSRANAYLVQHGIDPVDWRLR